MKPLYRILVSLVQARLNCKASGNADWLDKHTDRIRAHVKNHMPSGSGFDGGTTLQWGDSTADKLVFTTSFHHMNESGYDGWTDHVIRVYPDFVSRIRLSISGRNRNDIKEYIHEIFYSALTAEIEELP